MEKAFTKISSDLLIQSMMFNIDIDWETLTLINKVKAQPESRWLIGWKAKREDSDFNELLDIDWEDNGR